MKKISEDAAKAFSAGKNFKRTNTEVINCNNNITLYLFNNPIATKHKYENKIHVSHCGWESNTTKDRLNAVLEPLDMLIVSQRSQFYLLTPQDKIRFNAPLTIKIKTKTVSNPEMEDKII